MSKPAWEVGPVKLANGETAFINAINPDQEDYRYVGHLMVGASWMPAGWNACGRMMYAVRDSKNNLAPLPKKIEPFEATEGQGLQ